MGAVFHRLNVLRGNVIKKSLAVAVAVVGCGKSEQAGSLAKSPDCGEKVSKRSTPCPSCGGPLDFQQDAVAALEKLGATIEKDGEGLSRSLILPKSRSMTLGSNT